MKLKQKENWNIGRGILNTGRRTLEADIAAKIKDFFKQIKIYYSYRHAVTSIPKEEKDLHEDGNNIVNLINTLRKKDLSTFNRIVHSVKSIYNLKNITINRFPKYELWFTADFNTRNCYRNIKA